MLKSAAENGKAKFYGIYDYETFVGLIYFVLLDGAALIFYFAVDENLRGNGYGSKILSAMKERYPETRLFLEIDKPDDRAKNNSMRLRRKAFYERNGFVPCGFSTGFLVPYDVFSFGGKVTADEYRKIMTFFAKGVTLKSVLRNIVKKE